MQQFRFRYPDSQASLRRKMSAPFCTKHPQERFPAKAGRHIFSARFPKGGTCIGAFNRSGTATVEFAIVLPIIMALLLGAIEVGSAMNTQGALQNAARETARYATTPGATVSVCNHVATEALKVTGVKDAKIAVSHDPSKAKAGTFITVTVSAPYSSNSWLPGSQLLSEFNLSANVVMRKE